MLSTDENCDNLSIKQIIANDIKKYANESNVTHRQLIKDFSQNTNIVLRTLERFFEEKSEFTPHVRTIVGVYSQLYNSTSLAEIISKAPYKISDFIKKNHTNCIVGGDRSSDLSNNPAHQAKLTSSSLFNEIYILTAGDHGTDIAKIKECFGAKGLRVLDEMFKNGFVEIDNNDHIRRKKKLTWDNSIRKNFLQTLISDIYNEENLDTETPNYIGVAMGDVTPEDYNLIREKMKANYHEILKIINNSRPSYDEAVRLTIGEIAEVVEFKIEGDKLC